MEQTFGRLIRQARKDKAYSQRELAAMLSVDFTYLSKLENDRADYAPKEDVIRALARNLDINEEELIFLAGRLPQQYEALLKQNPQPSDEDIAGAMVNLCRCGTYNAIAAGVRHASQA